MEKEFLTKKFYYNFNFNPFKISLFHTRRKIGAFQSVATSI